MAIHIKGGAPLFQVYDMPASLAFYRDLLEFEVVDTAPGGPVVHWAMLRNGDGLAPCRGTQHRAVRHEATAGTRSRWFLSLSAACREGPLTRRKRR